MPKNRLDNPDLTSRGMALTSVLRWLVPLAVLALGLGITFTAQCRVTEAAQSDANHVFREQSKMVRNQLTDRLHEYRNMMLSGRALVQSSERVTRREWHRLVRTIELQDRFPEVYGMALVDIVPEGRLDRWLERRRTDVAPDFSLKVPNGAGEHPEGSDHFVIRFHEPEARNRAAWGLEVSRAGPNRVPYAESLRTGELRMTPGIALVQDSGEAESGVVITLPVRDRPFPQDRARPGWVTVAVSMDGLLESVLPDIPGGLRVQIWEDQGEAGMTALADSGDTVVSELWQAEAAITLPLEFGGRQWSITVLPNHPSVVTPNLADSRRVIGVGVVLSVLLSMLLMSVSGMRDRAESIAADRFHSLQQSEGRFRALIDGAPMCIKELSRDGEILSMNPAGLDLLGVADSACAVGHTLREFVDPDDFAWVTEKLHAAFAGESSQFQFHCITPGRGRRLFTTTLDPIESQSGTISRVISITSDVTEHAESSRLIRESEERYRSLVDAAPVCIKELDLDGRLMSINPGGLQIAELDSDEPLIGQRLADVVIEEDRHFVDEVVQRIAQGETRTFRYRFDMDSGKRVVLETKMVPRLDAAGNIVSLLSVAMDFTERSRAEEDLRESESRYRALVDNAPVCIKELDAQGCIVNVNPMGVAMAGAACEADLIGLPMVEIAAPEDREAMKQEHARAFAGEPRSFLFHVPSGVHGTKTMETFIAPRHGRNGTIERLVCVTQDVTERVRVEQSIRENEAKLENLTRVAPVGIYRTDADGNCVYVSERWCEIAGLTSDEALGEGWVNALHPDDRDGVFTAWNDFVDGKAEFDHEYRFRRPDGTWTWLRGMAVPERDDSGRLLGYVGAISDHTVRRDTEDKLRKNEADMRRLAAKAQEANATKSAFLANMSHEIRTPMSAILGYAEVLEQSATPEQRDATDTIRRNGHHLLEIINDILDISKIESGEMQVRSEPVEIRPFIHDLDHLLHERAEAKGLAFACTVEDHVPQRILSDEMRIRQVLINLVGNAIKFTQEGSVRVRVGSGKDGESVWFEVEDTGPGIRTSKPDDIFNPFVQGDGSQTRAHGGTGLGLAISRHLAKALDGSLIVDPHHHGGARFVFEIPNVQPQDETTTDPSSGAADMVVSSEQPRRRVLLAEDCVDNRRLLLHHLNKAGHDVVLAENGQEAMQHALEAQDKDQPFDVILMDMQMPILDGYGATQQLRAQGYTGRIVALTAHAMNHERDRCLQAGCDEFATKPILRDTLLALVAKPAPINRAA